MDAESTTGCGILQVTLVLFAHRSYNVIIKTNMYLHVHFVHVVR